MGLKLFAASNYAKIYEQAATFFWIIYKEDEFKKFEKAVLEYDKQWQGTFLLAVCYYLGLGTSKKKQQATKMFEGLKNNPYLKENPNHYNYYKEFMYAFNCDHGLLPKKVDDEKPILCEELLDIRRMGHAFVCGDIACSFAFIGPACMQNLFEKYADMCKDNKSLSNDDKTKIKKTCDALSRFYNLKYATKSVKESTADALVRDIPKYEDDLLVLLMYENAKKGSETFLPTTWQGPKIERMFLSLARQKGSVICTEIELMEYLENPKDITHRPYKNEIEFDFVSLRSFLTLSKHFPEIAQRINDKCKDTNPDFFKMMKEPPKQKAPWEEKMRSAIGEFIDKKHTSPDYKTLSQMLSEAYDLAGDEGEGTKKFIQIFSIITLSYSHKIVPLSENPYVITPFEEALSKMCTALVYTAILETFLNDLQIRFIVQEFTKNCIQREPSLKENFSIIEQSTLFAIDALTAEGTERKNACISLFKLASESAAKKVVFPAFLFAISRYEFGGDYFGIKDLAQAVGDDPEHTYASLLCACVASHHTHSMFLYVTALVENPHLLDILSKDDMMKSKETVMKLWHTYFHILGKTEYRSFTSYIVNHENEIKDFLDTTKEYTKE